MKFEMSKPTTEEVSQENNTSIIFNGILSTLIILSYFIGLFVLATVVVDKIKLDLFLASTKIDIPNNKINSYFLPAILMGAVTIVVSSYLIYPLIIKKHRQVSGTIQKSKFINAIFGGVLMLSIFSLSVYLGTTIVEDKNMTSNIVARHIYEHYIEANGKEYILSLLSPLFSLQFLFYIAIILSIVTILSSIQTLSNHKNVYISKPHSFTQSHNSQNHFISSTNSISTKHVPSKSIDNNSSSYVLSSKSNTNTIYKPLKPLPTKDSLVKEQLVAELEQNNTKHNNQDQYTQELNRIKHYYEQNYIDKETYEMQIKELTNNMQKV